MYNILSNTNYQIENKTLMNFATKVQKWTKEKD